MIPGLARSGVPSQAAPAHRETMQAFRNPGKGWTPYVFHPKHYPELSVPTGPSASEVTPLASSMVSERVFWAHLQPVDKDALDTTVIDGLLAAWPDRKFKLMISPGMRLDWGGDPVYTNGQDSLPDWMGEWVNEAWVPTADGFGRGTWTSVARGHEIPWVECEYDHPNYINGWANLIQLLADYWYATPLWQERISEFNISQYGIFGEWQSNYPWNGANNAERAQNRSDTCRLFVDQWFDTFDADPKPGFSMDILGSSLGVSFGVSYDLLLGDAQAVNYAISKGVSTVRRDVGPRSLQRLNNEIDEWQVIVANAESAPHHGEWGTDRDGRFVWLPRGNEVPLRMYQGLDAALGYKASTIGWHRHTIQLRASLYPEELEEHKQWDLPEFYDSEGNLLPNDPVLQIDPLARRYPGTNETNRDYFQRRCGYRFFIERSVYPSQIQRGQTLTLRQTWHQRAVAKLYKRHYLRASLVANGNRTLLDADEGALDAHMWPTGEQTRSVVSQFEVPAGTPRGVYTLELAVVDASGNPAMNLAIGGKNIVGLADATNDYSWYTVGPLTVI